MTDPETSDRIWVDVDLTYRLRVDVTDWFKDGPFHRLPNAQELRSAAEAKIDYRNAEASDEIVYAGYTIKARV